MKKQLRILAACVAGASLALLAGCTLADDYGHDERVTPVGKNLSVLVSARQIEFTDGLLIVSNSGEKYTGVAVVDTSDNSVLQFHRLERYGSGASIDVAPFQDSLVIASNSIGTTKLINLNSGKNNTLFTNDGGGALGPTLINAGGRIFLSAGMVTESFREILGSGSGFIWNMNRFKVYYAALSNDRVFLGGHYSDGSHSGKQILVLNAQTLLDGPVDSLDLHALLGDTTAYLTGLTAQDGRIFARMNVTDSMGGTTSSFVAVINASTLSLETTIPLLFKYSWYSTRNIDGLWYLCGTNGSSTWNGGGVEVVDLRSQTHRGMVVTNQSVGGEIRDFIPVAPHRGYVIRNSWYPSNSVLPVTY